MMSKRGYQPFSYKTFRFYKVKKCHFNLFDMGYEEKI